MADNSFGSLFRFTTFGESHGPAIGCVVDGCPPGLTLSEADLQQCVYCLVYLKAGPPAHRLAC